MILQELINVLDPSIEIECRAYDRSDIAEIIHRIHPEVKFEFIFMDNLKAALSDYRVDDIYFEGDELCLAIPFNRMYGWKVLEITPDFIVYLGLPQKHARNRW